MPFESDHQRDAALPNARGPLTAWLFARLQGGERRSMPLPAGDPLQGDDFHLALYCAFELAYRGFAGVDAAFEWDPNVLRFRRRLERRFEAALRAECTTRSAIDAASAVSKLLETFEGPSLSTYMATQSTREELLEFLVHRSAYQLKEADPHSWVIPRLVAGRRKAALIEIQTDEYGGGRPGRSHAELFEAAMAAAGLDPRYGAYLDVLPGATLATSNLISMFGLQRRLAGALLGHLAVFEMTSVGPMSGYVRACRRHGLPPAVREFYAVHVDADAHHGRLARERLLGGDLGADGIDPADVVFGAHALVAVEDRFARTLLDAWRTGGSALLGDGGPTLEHLAVRAGPDGVTLGTRRCEVWRASGAPLAVRDAALQLRALRPT